MTSLEVDGVVTSAMRRRQRRLPTRAADRRNGACRGLASQPGCKVERCARSPTGTEDGKLRDAAGASSGAVRAAGGSCPMLADTVADAVDQRTVKWLLKGRAQEEAEGGESGGGGGEEAGCGVVEEGAACHR